MGRDWGVGVGFLFGSEGLYTTYIYWCIQTWDATLHILWVGLKVLYRYTLQQSIFMGYNDFKQRTDELAAWGGTVGTTLYMLQSRTTALKGEGRRQEDV